jgi:cobalt/nickel transport system permease protein
MHIPDGFLTPPVWASLDALSIPAVSLLARKAKTELEESRIPLLGVMGAFVFAAQMINFPVGPGTSGHLVGGTLLACTLGPSAAALVMTAIVAVQALVFQDGGVIALGPNILNMAFAGVLAGYLPVRYFGLRWRRGSIFVGGVLSLLVSAVLALAELLLSGVKIPLPMLWLSLTLFAVSAIAEGLISVAAVEAIERLHPSWVKRGGEGPSRSVAVPAIALGAVLLAGVGVLIASASPDGLEKLAEQAGFSGRAKAVVATPLADYTLPWMNSDWAGKAAAGIAGVIVVFVLCVAGARILRMRQSKPASGGGA